MTRIKCHMTTLELVKPSRSSYSAQYSPLKSGPGNLSLPMWLLKSYGARIRNQRPDDIISLWCQQRLHSWRSQSISPGDLRASISQHKATCCSLLLPPMSFVIWIRGLKVQLLPILHFIVFSSLSGSTIQIWAKVRTLQWSSISSFYIHWD